ncbi:Aldo/keto reductase [Desarmillaria tabescens]|uniref:Aldo/keto reductase n=1 Tax=Armillaria tabescens TaxID=1929756 RepID=A0AA39JU96_ARMTA|nr:Aldo/keto reductase [Desarmillaria tabescens]KAK0449031.1 Aldo/keto reductase [Desarmillaria tabescens]
MSLFKLADDPPIKLGIYRVLFSRAGVRVSPLTLGAMSIGDKWAVHGMGAMNKESSFQLLDAYFDMGGIFIDTANTYQDQSSEEFIGEWTEKRGIRDPSPACHCYQGKSFPASSFLQLNPQTTPMNYVGNSTNSMHISVKASLKKLRTTYIDILYVHWWDYETSIPEVMDNLHSLVAGRKVLYLEISDTPAWVVSQANQYAMDHGKTPFVVYWQGRWGILDRSFEWEIIPMAKSLGLALAPWGVLGQGKLRSDAEEQRRKESGEKGRNITGLPAWERTEVEAKVSRALEKVAAEIGAKSMTAVAIAYVMQKAPYVFPIIGGRKVEHIEANIEALDILLSKEQVEYLKGVVPFDPGFPTTMIGNGSRYNPFLASTSKMAKLPALQPIKS